MIGLTLIFCSGLGLGVLLVSWLPNAWRRQREKQRLKHFKLSVLQAHQLKPSVVETLAAAQNLADNTSAEQKPAPQPLTLTLEDLPPTRPRKKILLEEETGHLEAGHPFEPSLTLIDFEPDTAPQHFRIKKQGDTH